MCSLLIEGIISRLNWLGRRTIPDKSWLAAMLASDDVPEKLTPFQTGIFLGLTLRSVGVSTCRQKSDTLPQDEVAKREG
jgi:hypothetical protein